MSEKPPLTPGISSQAARRSGVSLKSMRNLESDKTLMLDLGMAPVSK